MRIDAINRVSQLYQNNSVKKTAKKGSASGKDKFEISNAGKTLQAAKKAVAEAPEVREDKVKAIKEQLAAGTYSVSSKEFADKIVDRYFDLLG